MPSVIKLAIYPITDMEMQALRQFLRNQARAQIPVTLYETVANALITKNLKYKKTVPFNLQHC